MNTVRIDIAMAGKLLPVFVSTFFILQLFINECSGKACRGLSADVKCQCDDYGRCMQGTVEVDPWLQFALETQRELQVDIPVDHIQMFDAHNAFNNRAYGRVHGANDSCQWPPPYDNFCMGFANHEFSIIDLFGMGIRAIEIDNWWCEGAMRIAHLLLPFKLGCGEFSILFDDVIADIGNWMNEPGHENEILRIYLNEKFPQEHDAAVNDPLAQHLGHDRILSPADLRNTYGGVWPTMRRLREDGKRVLIVSSSDTTHQGKYIHDTECTGRGERFFTNYPQCGGKTDSNCFRFRSDATHYFFGIIYDGPTRVGAITDMSEMVKCRINLIATDMATPQLMESGVYTWAKGEPSLELHDDTCVMLNHNDYRWYTSSACDQSLSYACQSSTNPDVWTVSESTGPYDVTQDLCPIGYKFSVPHNGYRQQKLKEAMKGKSVWLNYTPWITGVFPPTEVSYITSPPDSSANINPKIAKACILLTIVTATILSR